MRAADVASIEITQGAESIALERAGEAWKRRGAGPAIDETKVKPLGGAFEAVAGARFAEDKDPAKTGLGKPTGVVTVRLRDKSASTLRIGALTKDSGEYYVQKVGSPDVVMVKKYVIDRFLKKPSELEAAPKTANAGEKAKKK